MATKITRLSPIDVANIAPLPFEQKREALLGIEEPKVFWGYDPITESLPKLLRVRGDLFGDLPDGSDDALIQQIERRCKCGPRQQAAVKSVAQAVVDWRNASGVTGRLIRPEPFPTTVATLQFCSNVAVIFEGRLFLVNLDCRSSMSLTGVGRAVMHSLIYHIARVGDLRDAGVAILRVPDVGSGKRRAILEDLAGEPRFSLAEVAQMVTETYTVWELILRSRREGGREAGTR